MLVASRGYPPKKKKERGAFAQKNFFFFLTQLKETCENQEEQTSVSPTPCIFYNGFFEIFFGGEVQKKRTHLE